MEVNHDAPEPVYRQVAGFVRDRIRAGEWGVDRPIPSEQRMIQEYGVARETVRKAIALLRSEGWVYTVPQRGSFVARRD